MIKWPQGCPYSRENVMQCHIGWTYMALHARKLSVRWCPILFLESATDCRCLSLTGQGSRAWLHQPFYTPILVTLITLLLEKRDNQISMRRGRLECYAWHENLYWQRCWTFVYFQEPNVYRKSTWNPFYTRSVRKHQSSWIKISAETQV